MKKTNLLILLGVIFLSLILVSGTLAAASASRNAVLLQNQVSDLGIAKDIPFAEGFHPTNPSISIDESGILFIPDSDFAVEPDTPEVPQQFPMWEKSINGQPWVPGIEITVETSDTIEIVDVITADPNLGFELSETWDSDNLTLLEWFTDPPPGVGIIYEGPAHLFWIVPPIHPEVVTITKFFHVEESTWLDTALIEELVLGERISETRPIVITKRPPDLWIDSFFDVSVYAGDTATFTLDYGNNGGYENNISIRNEFPETALFLASVPPPDEEDPGGRWVEWDVGDLAMDAVGSIDVDVAIQAGLQPSTTIRIVDYIYNHVGDEVGETIIDFHVKEPLPQEGDIYIKDNTTDDGSVPSSAPWWTSPDIWVRNDGDCNNITHQNPVAGVSTTVCVRVRNRMGTPVTNIDVDLYFASAALGLSWPVSWSGIGTINIPVLPPLSEIVVAIPWNTPNITGHFCMLARADSLEDPIGSGYDTVLPVDLVQNNNNISMRNLNIVDFPEITICEDLTDTVYTDQVPFDIINTADALVLVDIVFDSADFPLGAGEIVVDPGVLWGRWTSLTNFNQVGLTLIATAFPASINNVGMTPYELATLQMSMSAPGDIEFEISVTEWKDGHLVGGINYVRLLPTCTYLPIILKAYTPPLEILAGSLPLGDLYFNQEHIRGGLIE